jgi:hypothetical protein
MFRLRADVERFQCGEVPGAFEMRRAHRLEDWDAVVRRRGKEFVLVLRGRLIGPPNPEVASDGVDEQTGAVVWLDHKLRFARTHTRLYALGQPAGDIPEGIEK